MDKTPPADPPPEPNPFQPPQGEGAKPPRPAYRPLSILGTFLGVVAVLVAGVIAFVATCFPIGLVAFSQDREGVGLLVLAWVLGAAVSLLAGFGAFRLIFRSRWRRLPPAEEVDR